MKLLNERNQVREVAAKWRSQYGSGSYGADKRVRAVGAELAALDVETASAAEVAEIVGNNVWVRMQTCGECSVETWNIVEIGEVPNYESATAYVCRDCLLAALKLIGNAK